MKITSFTLITLFGRLIFKAIAVSFETYEPNSKIIFQFLLLVFDQWVKIITRNILIILEIWQILIKTHTEIFYSRLN